MRLLLQLCVRAEGQCRCRVQTLPQDAVRVTPGTDFKDPKTVAAVHKFKDALKRAGWTVQPSGVAASVAPPGPPRLVYEAVCPLHGHLVHPDLPPQWFVVREEGRRH